MGTFVGSILQSGNSPVVPHYLNFLDRLNLSQKNFHGGDFLHKKVRKKALITKVNAYFYS